MVYRLQANEGDSQTSSLDRQGIYAFLVLNIIGGLGMLFMLLTAALSPKVHRLPTWYSFCASWVLSAISYTLLFLTAEQFTPSPIYTVCYIQAALIYSMPPTTSATTLALLLHILLSFPEPPSDRWKKISLLTSCLLVMTPYTIFLILFIGVSLFQTYHPSTLQKAPEGTYCDSSNPAWLRVSFSVVAGLSMMIIVVQTLLLVKLYRSYWASRLRAQSSSTTIRGIAFTLLGFISLVLSIIFDVADKNGLPFDILIATFPVLALLVFGTQKDMMLVWCFWKSRAPYKAEGRGSIFFGRDLNAVP